jgi:hypothetical protein
MLDHTSKLLGHKGWTLQTPTLRSCQWCGNTIAQQVSRRLGSLPTPHFVCSRIRSSEVVDSLLLSTHFNFRLGVFRCTENRVCRHVFASVVTHYPLAKCITWNRVYCHNTSAPAINLFSISPSNSIQLSVLFMSCFLSLCPVPICPCYSWSSISMSLMSRRFVVSCFLFNFLFVHPRFSQPLLNQQQQWRGEGRGGAPYCI